MALVYSKTPKGLRETTGKTKDLEPEMLGVLKACKDNQSADEIAAAWPETERKTIVWAVGELTSAGYLREIFVERRQQAGTTADEGMDLDFASITSARPVKPPPADPRIEAEQQARREAEAKIRREAEEKVRREAEAKIRREAEERVRREVEEKARIETEERARLEAEERIRREAEEKARREAEEKARRETKEKARREAEEKIRREAGEKARREAEEKIRLETEEKVRREVEEKARIEAVERTRREAEEKIRLETEEKVRREVEEKARIEAVERTRREAEEKIRREAEEKVRREAEEKVRREVEEKARIEAVERTRREAEEKIRREAEEKVRREVEEKARREAEEKARREAEEKARIEAEERAHREAEEKIRREAEEKVRREEEEKAKRAAVEKIRREALEKFRREEEEKARREAEERARREAEEKARREAEERARIEAEERARCEAEENLRREAEEKARREAEESARIEAEERARIEAEERARCEAEENLRREAEEKARREAEESARIEAEERARIEAEERARREAEEKLRREEEERARRKAEEKARREAEERARIEEEERDRERIRQRMLERKEVHKRQSRVAAIVIVVVLPFLALFLIKFLPFDGKRQAFETMAASALGVSVKAGSAQVELVPKMKLTLENVVFGEAADGVQVKRVVLGAPLSVLWQMPAEFDSLHLDDVRLPLPVLLKLLGTSAGKLPLKAGTFSASRVILAAEPAFLPPLEVEAKLAGGQVTEFAAQADGADSGKVKLSGVRGPGAWSVSLNAERFDLPLAAKLKLVDFSATGQLSPERLTISGFKGWLHNGELGGSATLTWQGNWKLGGKFSATRVSASAAAPGWFKDGVFDAQGDFLGDAAKSQDLLPKAQIQAQVGMSRGVLAGIDFDRVLQGRGQGEQYTFESLKANLFYDAGRIEATQVRVAAGALAATGTVTIAPDQTARGRVSVEVKSGSSRQNVGLSIGGTATKPQYQR
jgi:hypothetical protein